MAAAQYQPAPDLLGPLFEEMMSRPSAQDGRTRDRARVPEADVLETDSGIELLLDTPGMTPGDIEIGLEDNLLTIRGERRPTWRAADEAQPRVHLAERRFGEFSRSFVLPREVDAERIEARMEEGVLRVSIPKSDAVRRRRIEVRSAGGARQIDASAGD